MSHAYNKISLLVKQQLPEYVRENYPIFADFLKAYYEYLEQDGEAAAIIQHARSYADIDLTIDSFVDYFMKQFVYGIPLSIFDPTNTESKRFLVKYISSLYRSKGSVNALRFLFRLAFNEEIDVIFPSDYLLRPSDGKWNRTAEVRTSISGTFDPTTFIGKAIVGSQSGIITGIESYTPQPDGTYSLFVDVESFNDIDTAFVQGENLVFTDTGLAANVSITVLNTVTGVNIIDGGLGYKTSDRVRFITLGTDPAMDLYASTYTLPLLNGYFWNVARTATTVATIEAPDGTLTATKLTEDTQTGGHYLYRVTQPYTAGLTYTQSIYAKAGERSAIAMAFPGGAFSTAQRAVFNLSTGIASLDAGTPTYKITALDNGWYRCSITATATTTANVNTITVYMSNGVSVTSYTGDGTSSVYLWKPQLETGTVATGSANVVLTDVTATISKVDETGKIVSVSPTLNSSNITSNTAILIAAPSDTRSATYTLAGNIATVRLDNNLKHGLSPKNTVNVVVSTGTLQSNNYFVSEVLTPRVFQVQNIAANSSGNLTITYKNTANLAPIVGTLIPGARGYGISVDGQLDTTILLQDSEKWQQYSYIIRSNLDIDTWADLVKKTLHPAGMALFGEVTIYTQVGQQSSVYAGPINTAAYDAFILLIEELFNATAALVAMPTTQDSYYSIDFQDPPEYIDNTVSIYSLGSTRRTVEQFKFDYGNAFPINIIASEPIQNYTSVNYNLASSFQPPSYREQPYRDTANANIVLFINVNA